MNDSRWREDAALNDLLMLTPEQIRRIERYFPLSHGVPRVDDRRVLSGILFVIRNGLRWRDAPAGYGPHKTIYNGFIRWSRLGVFSRKAVTDPGLQIEQPPRRSPQAAAPWLGSAPFRRPTTHAACVVFAPAPHKTSKVRG